MEASTRPSQPVKLSKPAFFKLVGYEPHPHQLLYHNSQARFRVPVCGRRFGKSTMAGHDIGPDLFMPNKRIWIVGPTYDLGEKEFRVVWDDLLVRMKMGRDKAIKRAYNKRSGTMFIKFPWNTEIEVRSADHPENLVGEALDRAVMSEAAKHKVETWERFIRPALADRRGSADFPTTPEGFNWLYNLWMRGRDAKQPLYESWRFPSWFNSAVYPGGRTDPEILDLEQTTTPEWFLQEIGADFASFVGKIFPEWDDVEHVRTHKFNPDWPNYVTFDWGYTNPLAAVEFQVSPDDKVYVWREHYRAYLTLHEHLSLMKDREQPPGYRLDMAFGDAADPEAAMTVSQYLVPCIANPDAKTNWRQGIDVMRNMMKLNREKTEHGLVLTDEYGAPYYEPSFFVDPSCTNTLREINNYRSKTPIKGRNVPEFGDQISDHTVDAIRYGLMHIFALGATHHLTETITPTTRQFVSRSTHELSGFGSTEASTFFTTGGVF